MSDQPYIYRCQVVEWVDGDTVKVNIDLGFEIHWLESVRVYGINAPEIHAKDIEERKHAVQATNFARSLAPPSSFVMMHSHKATKEREKYGRWLADITLKGGADFGMAMIDAGMAVPYTGGKR